MTRVSVIIPIYNAANTLMRCLNSVISQTVKPFEVLVIDDGSTDSSKAILDEYAVKSPNIRVITQNNKGVSVARNVGIEAAIGDWLMFVDADDFLEPNTLEILTQNISGEMALAGLTIHTSEKIYNQNLFLENAREASGAMSVEKALSILSYYTFCGPVCKLFRSDIVKQYNILFPTDMRFGEDTVFVYTYLKYVKQMSLHATHLYHCDKSNDASLTAMINSKVFCNSINRIYPIMKDVYLAHNLSTHYADYIYLDALQTATHLSYSDHEMKSYERIGIYKLMFANESFNVIEPQCSRVFVALGKMHAWHLCDWYLKIRN